MKRKIDAESVEQSSKEKGKFVKVNYVTTILVLLHGGDIIANVDFLEKLFIEFGLQGLISGVVLFINYSENSNDTKSSLHLNKENNDKRFE